MASKKRPVYPDNLPSKKEGANAGKGRTNNPNPKHGKARDKSTSRKK